MHAAPKNPKHPNITHDDLLWADGFLFGFPTRYGTPAAQFKQFWDSTGQLWTKGALMGKPIANFFGTGTQGGGQETTALTAWTNFVHHGMIIVPMGYPDPRMFSNEEVHGGSPYGAGTFANADGSRQPSKMELSLAENQGKSFTGTANALKVGREALAGKK
jgi:NAD(P)H dehydrogenase (quinone)